MKMTLDEAIVVAQHISALGYPSQRQRDLLALAEKRMAESVDAVTKRYYAERSKGVKNV